MTDFIVTTLADEINVSVYFNYNPEEKQTWDYPGCNESIDIEAVLVNGDEDKDIQAVLSDRTINSLIVECFDYLEEE